MAKRVIVLGGGVAGMSAAHELVERGFAVTVFERHRLPGGKARSMPFLYSGTVSNVGAVHVGRLTGPRRPDLPGEHGFRFFPRFYKHVVDSMARIPFGKGRTVADNLVETTRTALLRFDQHGFTVPAHAPRSLGDMRALLREFSGLFDSDIGISQEEYAFIAERTWQILTSCEERRLGEYEQIGWWEFIGAPSRSNAYQKLFGLGYTRSVVAAQAQRASAKTIGDMYVQYLFNVAEPGISADRVLNGPTNHAWIQPWLDYLTARGVDYHLGTSVRAIHCSNGRITSVTVESAGSVREIQGDYYVAALPVIAMSRLITDTMAEADPSLANIIPLSANVAWMNGAQFYVTEPTPINPGHIIYLDSPWALTSVSQAQFWPDIDLSRYGNGAIRDIISVDISDWTARGLNGKTAAECTRQEIKDEVWQQLQRSVNVAGAEVLRDECLHSCFIDPDINVLEKANSEPLLVNLVNTWHLRPSAVTRIPNLFLAGDYVRTNTDLACMEAANEAARAAVNGILAAAGSGQPPCRIWRLHEPILLEPWRAYDRARYLQGLPWDGSMAKLAVAALSAVQWGATVLEERIIGAAAVGTLRDRLRSYAHTLQLDPEDALPESGSSAIEPDVLARALSGMVEHYLRRFPESANDLQTLIAGLRDVSTHAAESVSLPDLGAPPSGKRRRTPSDRDEPAEATRGRVRFVDA